MSGVIPWEQPLSDNIDDMKYCKNDLLKCPAKVDWNWDISNCEKCHRGYSKGNKKYEAGKETGEEWS